MATFHFDLVSPEKIAFSGEVEQVDIPGREGDFGVLAGHAPLVASLRPGIINITVAGKHQKIIVLGGLIEDSYSVDLEAIPVLEKIPYLGALFRNVSRTRKRTNLLVFLRPVIMRDEAAVGALTLDRYDYIRANQHQVQQEAPETLPGEAAVSLPADPKSPFRPQ